MNTELTIADDSDATSIAESLAALAQITFSSLDPAEIVATAIDGAEALCACRIEASYRAVDDEMTPCPPDHAERHELTEVLRRGGWQGSVVLRQWDWGWALPLRHGGVIRGCLVVGALEEPPPDQVLLLTLLAQQAGAALACAELHQRDVGRARQLKESNDDLASAVSRLATRTRAHELLEAALAAGHGEDGIVAALYRLTGRTVCLEDKFGNLRAWSGPGRPLRHPKPKPSDRERFLHSLATHGGPMRYGDRVSVLIHPHAETLGVVAFVVADDEVVGEDDLFALQRSINVLGLELSHQRSLAELHLSLRRELLDDLLGGTDADGAYARAEALGHDLRRPHHVVVVHTGRGAGVADVTAVSRAAANLRLKSLVGQQGGLIALIADGRPALEALHHEVSRQLGYESSTIGIGPRCEGPADYPRSLERARRALNVRLHSADPHGASDYEDLGFYHLVDAAHTAGVAEEYLRQWLGTLIDYDAAKNSEFVHTLSHYLECGGNYDETAAALHVHRSTLRYRLGRIADLTDLDLRDVDTRFNLHAASRVWRFIGPHL